MKKKVIVIDTSLLCVYLKIPGMERCGKDDDVWNYKRVYEHINKAKKDGATLVLPLASIIETGNHITRLDGNRYAPAKRLSEIIAMAADETSPWSAFVRQADLWKPEGLKQLAEEWIKRVGEKFSIGDVAIKQVADYYKAMDFNVEILTADQVLKAYEPTIPSQTPRRRK